MIRLLGGTCAVLLVLLGTVQAADLPDHMLTPGDIDPAATREVVCSSSTKERRNVSRSLRMQVFRRYGVDLTNRPECSGPAHACYENDHLIGLELGGSNDITNLWPQPYDGTWNAHMKDRLENKLHQLVCAGLLSLEDAQREISTDWIASYRARIGGVRLP